MVISIMAIASIEITFGSHILYEYALIDIDLLYGFHHELEIITALVLAILAVTNYFAIKQITRDNQNFEQAYWSAYDDFNARLGNQFDNWLLSRVESEVAALLIRGKSIQQIADIRGTKLGTIKSQCNSIYTKSGLNGRNELNSFFIKDLLDIQKEN